MLKRGGRIPKLYLPMTLDGNPTFGVLFDIDGVLVKGPKPLPHAVESIEKLRTEGVPFVCVTNNGMELEAERAARLSRVLRLQQPIDGDAMLMAHSSLRDEAALFGPFDLVLVTGIAKTCAKSIMRNHGFRNVATVAEYARCHPELLPNKHFAPFGDSEEERGLASIGRQKVAAVFIIETPEDWHQDLQVITDIVRSNGYIGQPSVSPQDVQVFCANYDFTFPYATGIHRLGPGAFMDCLDLLYRKDVGRELQVIKHGKPFPRTYKYARHALALQLEKKGADPALAENMRVYCVGDNPMSDIRGANAAGPAFTSILVCTGVFQGRPGLDNDPLDPADHVVADVGAAVDLILQMEGKLQLRAPGN